MFKQNLNNKLALSISFCTGARDVVDLSVKGEVVKGRNITIPLSNEASDVADILSGALRVLESVSFTARNPEAEDIIAEFTKLNFGDIAKNSKFVYDTMTYLLQYDGTSVPYIESYDTMINCESIDIVSRFCVHVLDEEVKEVNLFDELTMGNKDVIYGAKIESLGEEVFMFEYEDKELTSLEIPNIWFNEIPMEQGETIDTVVDNIIIRNNITSDDDFELSPAYYQSNFGYIISRLERKDVFDISKDYIQRVDYIYSNRCLSTPIAKLTQYVKTK